MSDAEFLKELVGSVCTFYGFGNVEGRVDKVGENWVLVTDKKGVQRYIHLKKVSFIERKPK